MQNFVFTQTLIERLPHPKTIIICFVIRVTITTLLCKLFLGKNKKISRAIKRGDTLILFLTLWFTFHIICLILLTNINNELWLVNKDEENIFFVPKKVSWNRITAITSYRKLE